MFRYRITLFHLLGFAVRVDASWLLLALFITWSLASGFFPALYPDQPTASYWSMGIAGALGLFISIIVHEFSHSLVARRFGLPIKGITLFIFGGVAEMDEEPPSAKSEFFMAIAGPIASVVIGLLCYAAYALAMPHGGFSAARSVLYYLAVINIVLAVFNMIPAFPLDGGRVLRAVLWHYKGNIRSATRIAAGTGRLFGFWLIALAVFSALTGNLLGGIWWFLIGLFVIQAAQGAYQQLLLRDALQGEPVRRFMTSDPTTVPAAATIQELVDDYVYRYYFKLYPVVEDDRPVGCVHTEQIKDVPREEWGTRTVRDVMQPLSEDTAVEADADAMRVLSTLNRTGRSRLLVLERGRLVGVIALKDLLKFFQMKVELEDHTPAKRWFER